MIKANELRLGNWAHFTGEHYKQATDFEMIEFFSRNGNPIELTPEILEKAGFVKNPHEAQIWIINNDNGYKGNYKLHYSKKNGTTLMKNAGGKFVRLITVYYVHQLQNLYFALTGQELEINL